MYTAEHARKRSHSDLDERIQRAVEESRDGKSATLRFYMEDWFRHSLEHELQKRGFININVPDIVLKGDAYFEWANTED